MAQDLLLVLFLALLETALSLDNALVLALLARELPRKQQKKALTYGLIGAIVFRLLALFIISALIRWTWIKVLGGAYLVFIAGKHLTRRKTDEMGFKRRTHPDFWRTVIAIELTDIAFAIDSILAAIALTPKFWVIFAGGMIGVIAIRFAANGFISVLKRFPGLETSAYAMVLLIGVKVIIEATEIHPLGLALDFHAKSDPAFWVFWGMMLVCVLLGFRGSNAHARKN